MTDEEALEILRKFKPCEQGFCNGGIELLNNLGGLAMELAIKSLEKQIPKTTQKVEVQGYMRKHWNPKCCPTCRTQHYGKPKYCDECGQALDWGGEDER